MAKSRVRLKEVANATGYSVNTVSLALRGSHRLPEKTRELILREADRMNYLPNNIARSLVVQSTKTVGLVLTDIMNPTITQTARSIERELAKAGYGVMLASSDHELENEKRAINLFLSSQVDGILIYPTNRNQVEHIQKIENSGCPVVILSDIPQTGLDVVAIDDRKGAQIAVSHLLAKGHRQIAILDGAQSLGNNDKLEGAQRAVKDAGLAPSSIRVIDPMGHSATHGFNAMETALYSDIRPSAIFATTDSLAIGAARWCRENNMRIPEDLAIVGFDNTEASEFCSTPLTTVNYATDDVSRNAVGRIISRIESAEVVFETMIKLIEPDLVTRNST